MRASWVAEEDLPLQRMDRWERERADRVFLTQPYAAGKLREWTWAQCLDEVRRVAAYLKSQNWEPGSRVAILSKNCAWWIMADFAIWMAGHVAVPVYPSLRPETVRQILEHSGALACFVGPTDDRESATLGVPAAVKAIRFPFTTGACEPLWETIVAETPRLEGSPKRPAEDLATIIYTSGTTGMPKGVMHSFTAFAFAAKSLAEQIGLSADERVLSYLPLAHIVERTAMEALALRLGWHIFFTEGLDTFVTDLQRAQPTLFLSVPRLLAKFQQGVFAKVPKKKLDRLLRIPVLNRAIKKRILHQLGLDTVRFAACGAAPLPVELLRWFRRLGLRLVEGYGMTETLITNVPRPEQVQPGYVGPAVPGVEAKIGPASELLVRSPMNMMGYHRDPEATRACFTEDGFFRTGDIGEIGSNGQLKLAGRLKEQFKTSKGKYVAPAPIEGKLAAHPGVEACCLMGTGLPSPFAVVVLAPEARKHCADPHTRRELEESLEMQMRQVNGELDPHERLSFIVVADGPWTVANGLITPTLKIRRASLENQYLKYIDSWREQNKPVIWETAS